MFPQLHDLIFLALAPNFGGEDGRGCGKLGGGGVTR